MADIDVFLIAGQSNAVGQGLSAGWSPAAASGVIQWNTATGITAASDPVGGATYSSAWPAFGNVYVASTGRNICFVPAAVDGTIQYGGSGATSWDTTGTLYSASNTLVSSALSALTTAGYNPIFQGILWCQGEADAVAINASSETQANYKGAFTTMIANYRGVYGSSMPFYIFKIGTDNTVSDTGYAQVREAQEQVAASDPNSFIVFRGAQFYQTLHYQIQGQYNQMGYQGAQSVVAIQQSKLGLIATLSPYYRQQTTFGPQCDFYEKRSYNIVGISGWQTLVTLTPNEVHNVWITGIVSAKIMSDTANVGSGVRISNWAFFISNGTPTVSVIGTDATSSSSANFQLAVSGNNILVQVQSSGGTYAMDSGLASIDIHVPNAGSYAGIFEMYLT